MSYSSSFVWRPAVQMKFISFKHLCGRSVLLSGSVCSTCGNTEHVLTAESCRRAKNTLRCNRPNYVLLFPVCVNLISLLSGTSAEHLRSRCCMKCALRIIFNDVWYSFLSPFLTWLCFSWPGFLFWGQSESLAPPAVSLQMHCGMWDRVMWS